MNRIALSPGQYEELLENFPEAYREKLRLYTGEELYYAYRLATYKPTKHPVRDETGKVVDYEYKSGDVAYMALRTKLFRWLNGKERHPIYPTAWAKLGTKFRAAFHEEYQLNETETEAPKPQLDVVEATEKLQNHFKHVG